jgi:hypothetical protein
MAIRPFCDSHGGRRAAQMRGTQTATVHSAEKGPPSRRTLLFTELLVSVAQMALAEYGPVYAVCAHRLWM